MGSGRQAGIVEHYRGATEMLHLRPKLKLDIVVADGDLERALAVRSSSRTLDRVRSVTERSSSCR